MGGEPTFVSRDDATTPQWNTDADGPEKRALANDARRPAARGVRRRRGRAPRPGQVVPGRAAAALEHRAPVAHRRRPALGGPGAVRRPVGRGAADPDAAAERRGARAPGHRDPRAARRAAAPGVRGPARRARRRGPPARRRAGRRALERRPTPTSSPSARRRGRPSPPAGCCRSPPARTTGRARPGGSAAAGWCSRPGTSPVGLRLPLDSISWEDPEYAGEPSYLEAGPPLRPDRAPRSGSSTPRARRPRRWPSRPATATCTSSCRRPSGSRTTPTCSRLVEVATRTDRLPGRARGLRPAAGPAAHPARRHARPRRHRGQRAADRELGRAARPDHDAVRRGAAQRG